jgi:DNA processing protein
MDHDELAAWLRLTLTPGIGDETARKLLTAFGPPPVIFQQTPAALRQVTSSAKVDALLVEPEELSALTQTTWEWLEQDRSHRQVVVLGDAFYPQALLHIDSPPLLLYMMGRIELPISPPSSISIVGSRNPTPQGTLNARQFGQVLREAGFTIVSGMALGVDGAAHEGALQTNSLVDPQRLATLAVVGTGLDRVYPKSHFQLAHRIAEQGLIISEYPLGTPALSPNFPRRNRLIAGLSCATLVVEATVKSGSLITARMAADQGKEVFAIPGSIHSAQSRGCHALIRQGAKLVESAQDILEELPASTLLPALIHSPKQAIDETTANDGLLRVLGFDPVSLDALQARTGLPTPQLQARLMSLELEGAIARLPGGQFQRIVKT